MNNITSNKILVCVSLMMLMIYSCSTRKKYTTTENQRFKTVEILPADAPQERQHDNKPAFSNSNTKIRQADAKPGILVTDHKLSNTEKNKSSAKYRPANIKYKNPQPEAAPKTSENNPNKDAIWAREAYILCFFYLLGAFIVSLFFGFTGLFSGIFLLLPIGLAAFLIFNEGRRLRWNYDDEVRENKRPANKYINYHIAIRVSLEVFFVLLLLMVVFLAAFAASEGDLSGVVAVLFAVNAVFVLAILLVAIVLMGIYDNKRKIHSSKEKGKEEAQKEIPDPPYKNLNTPWHKLVAVFAGITLLVLIGSAAVPILSIPFFGLLFLLSLGNQGEFTIFTRLLLVIASICLFAVRITIIPGLLFPIISLVIALITLFITRKHKTFNDTKNYKSIYRATKNVGLMALITLALIITFISTPIWADILDTVVSHLGFSFYLLLIGFIILAINGYLKHNN